MGATGGPNIERDGLVFGYDTGYPIVDNDTSTIFSKGEPTINTLASTIFGYAGITLGTDEGGTYLQTNSDTTGYNYIKVPNITVSSSETYTWSFELKSEETITQSGNKYYFDTNEHSNEFSTSNDASRTGFTQIRPSSLIAGQWVKFSLSVTMKPNLTGAYSYDFLNFIKPHFTSKKIYYRNMQFEHNKSHHTPFTDGTRSSTQSLIDLKKTRDIDVSGVSFDSNGQITFDGTDDYIPISTYTFGNGNWTVNMWVNADNINVSNLLSNTSGGPVTNAFGFDSSKIHYRNYDGAWKTHNGNTTLTTDRWYHLTWVNYEGASAALGTMKMYVDGVADSSVFNSYVTNGGPCNAIGSNWFSKFNGKITNCYFYNKALTDSQIKQNFNASKKRFGL